MYNTLMTILKRPTTYSVLLVLTATLGLSLGDATTSALVVCVLYVLTCVKEMLKG